MKKSLKLLLSCGIISSVLYIATDIFAATLWRGYSYIDQSVSELSAIGAPTRSLSIVMLFLYNPLLIAFGTGVWKAAGPKRGLRVTGMLWLFGGCWDSCGCFSQCTCAEPLDRPLTLYT